MDFGIVSELYHALDNAKSMKTCGLQIVLIRDIFTTFAPVFNTIRPLRQNRTQ